MKIKTEYRLLRNIPQNGYTAYDTNPRILSVKYCRWWAYPVFKLVTWLHYEKVYLYCVLNEIGAIQTPAGSAATFSDIWRYRR